LLSESELTEFENFQNNGNEALMNFNSHSGFYSENSQILSILIQTKNKDVKGQKKE